MSCSRPAVCANSWSFLDIRTWRGDVAGEGGHRRAVARRARVALVERADEPGEHAPRQVRVLARALAGGDDQPRHVGERDDVQQDEDQREQAELRVDPGDDRQQRHVEQHGRERRGGAADRGQDRLPVEQREERRREDVVGRHRRGGDDGEQCDERRAPLVRIDRLEGDRCQERGRRRAREVDEQRPPAVAVDDPHRDVGDRRNEERRNRAEETNREHPRDKGRGETKLGCVPGSEQLGNEGTKRQYPC